MGASPVRGAHWRAGFWGNARGGENPARIIEKLRLGVVPRPYDSMGGRENEVVLAPFFLIPCHVQQLRGGIGRRRRDKLHPFLVIGVPFDFLVEQLNVARGGNSLLLHVLPP